MIGQKYKDPYLPVSACLRESDAILVYVADKYDKERRISSDNESEKYQILQWLFFQSSGQGYPSLIAPCRIRAYPLFCRPYFGQFYHFVKYHPHKFPSAIERYKNEILRVFKVLDGVLAKEPWLVGGKMTIADLSFAVYGILFL